MSDINPEAVAEVLEGVTPGPWWFDNNEGYGANAIHAPHKSDPRAYESVAHSIGDSAEAEANARFIAWAREAVPALAAKLAEVRAEVWEEAAKMADRKHGEEFIAKGRNPADYTGRFSLFAAALRARKKP
jgi:hypothetical protein